MSDQPEKLKVLVVAPTPFFADRGTHIRILEEALALETLGHEVTIATYHIGSDIPEALGSGIDVRRIRRWLFWYQKLEAGPDWQKIVLDLLLIKKTLFLARTKRPDIIHGHLHEGVLIGWIVQKLLFWRGIRLVGDFHGSLVKEMVSHKYLGAGLLKGIFQRIEHTIDNLGDAAVTSSWENTDEISHIRKGQSTETLLDGVRLEMFEGVPDRMIVRRRFDIPEDKTVVIYTGALIPNKGIGFFLEAIPIVAAEDERVHFVIAGFPVDKIERYLSQPVFQERVTVISPLPYFTLAEVLGMADIGVDPKEAEVRQASGKLLQYMGAGLPIACFDTRNNREYLAEGGSYASEVSAAGLAKAILRLVADPEARARQGRSNRERAERFTWKEPARRLENIYRTLL
ncbi:MAG: glycosyltransferase family 4 protein [Candidatus Moranbacteria bacterium]|nr:glycosyltransferase family 4 protein [Candidatus Moranbacteria bacterium]MBP6034320.1 glycosyltransferase family 4 protein [Candidatus Moranbacteria bacterium]MBP7695815.1 glycosyltransferase family 4 protein [Candidatus Moranbacteria bacterium]